MQIRHWLLCTSVLYTPINLKRVTQLLGIYDDIVQSLGQNQEIHFVFFDVAKEFDRVWHRALIYKLHKFGIRDPVLSWLSSYLSDRHQCVVLNGTKLDPLPIQAGVPQGFVLGPLLFILFINDLPIDIENNISIFADDTCLYTTSDDLIDMNSPESLEI